MSKRLICFFLSFILVFSSFAVSTAAEGETNDHEIEFNGDLARAQRIDFGTKLFGNVECEDFDNFKFETASQCKVSYEFISEGNNSCFNIEGIQYEGNVSGEILVGPGVHYIEVKYGQGWGPYSILINYSELGETNEIEDNDRLESAQELAFGKSMKGRVDSDVDYYKYKTTETGKVTYNFTSEYNNLYFNIDGYEYYAKGTGELWLTPGTHYIQVSQWNGIGSYSVALDFKAVTGLTEVEENNTSENAQEIKIGSTVKGVLTNNDTDNYKFVTTETGNIVIRSISGNNRFKLCYNIDGNQCYGNVWLEPGNHIIEIPKWDQDGPYSIDLDFVSVPGFNEVEDNDSWDNAQKIEFGNTVIGALTYEDTDIYRYETTEIGKVSFDFLNKTEYDNDLSFYIDGNEYHQSTYGELWLTPGTHIIKVSKWYGYGAYSIALNFSGVSGLNEVENNNSMESAQVVKSGDDIKGVLLNGDVDCYKLVSSKAGKINFNFTCENNNLKLNIDGREYNGNYLGEIWVQSGIHSIQISGGNGYGYGSYEMKLNFSAVSGLNEIENNDGFNPQNLKSGDRIVGISEKGDVDCFRLNSTVAGKITVDFTDESNSLYYDIDGERYYGSSFREVWVQAGDHNIIVSNWKGSGAYNFTVDFSTIDGLNEAEYNDGWSNAQQIDTTNNINGILAYNHDIDCYSLYSAEAGKIKYDFTNKNRNMYLSIDGFPFYTQGSGEICVQSGMHYIQIEPGFEAYGPENGSGPYSLNVDFSTIDGLNEVEDNNTLENAQTISLDSTIKGILANNDRDFYKLTIDKLTKVNYNFSRENNGLVWRLNDTELNGSGNIWLNPGTHTIEVSAWSSNRGEYQFSINDSSNTPVPTSTPTNKPTNTPSSTPLAPKGNLDGPTNSKTIAGVFRVFGWFLDGVGVSKIEVLVDEKVIGQAIYGATRTDVNSAYPLYNVTRSGYYYDMDTNKLTNGQHTISIKETGNTGIQTTLPQKVFIVSNAVSTPTNTPTPTPTNTSTSTPLAAKGSLDGPTNDKTLSGVFRVFGWFLDGVGVSKIEVMVDGALVGQATYGTTRTDVNNAYPMYNNDKCGYYYDLDTNKQLANGQHTLVIKETGNTGVQTTLPQKVFTVSNAVSTPTPTPTSTPTSASLAPKGYLDGPTNNKTIMGVFRVFGWFLDGVGVSKIEVMVDGELVGQATYGTTRTDVNNAFPAYNNTKSGYYYDLDTNKLTTGEHTITIRETGNTGVQTSLSSRKFIVHR